MCLTSFPEDKDLFEYVVENVELTPKHIVSLIYHLIDKDTDKLKSLIKEFGQQNLVKETLGTKWLNYFIVNNTSAEHLMKMAKFLIDDLDIVCQYDNLRRAITSSEELAKYLIECHDSSILQEGVNHILFDAITSNVSSEFFEYLTSLAYENL